MSEVLFAAQARVGGLVGQAAHCGQLLINSIGGQMARFEIHKIARNHEAVEGRARLGAAPRNKLIEGVFVDSPRTG